MNVLSLFDGISCGQIALNRAGIDYNNYYACEIDKFAKKVTQENFPNTFQLGDINNWREWGFDLGSIDLIFAGFPCQAWSLAGKGEGENDPRGQLVHTLLDIWRAVEKENPNVKFLFENVKMKNKFIHFINDLFGVSGRLINSLYFSAQNRERYYWTNIDIFPIPKKNINLFDIMVKKEPSRGFKWLSRERSDYILKLASISAAERKAVVKKESDFPENITIKPKRGDFILNNHLKQNGRIYNPYSLTLTCSSKHYIVDKKAKKLWVREFEMSEYRAIQTISEYILFPVSDNQQRKQIGNGWTVDVIAHILKGLK